MAKEKNIEIYFTNGEFATITGPVIASTEFGECSLKVVMKDGRETVFPFANVLRFELV